MLYLSFCAQDYSSLPLFHDDDKCITASGQVILHILVPICQVAIIHFAQKI